MTTELKLEWSDTLCDGERVNYGAAAGGPGMSRKYRALRGFGFDPFAAAFLSVVSVIVGQPDNRVSVLNVDFDLAEQQENDE